MATMQNSYDPEFFRVIHPLNDVPEQKCSSEGLGHIAMTPVVRVSLTILRGYKSPPGRSSLPRSERL